MLLSTRIPPLKHTYAQMHKYTLPVKLLSVIFMCVCVCESQNVFLTVDGIFKSVTNNAVRYIFTLGTTSEMAVRFIYDGHNLHSAIF